MSAMRDEVDFRCDGTNGCFLAVIGWKLANLP